MHMATTGYEPVTRRVAPRRQRPRLPRYPSSRFARHRLRFARRRLEGCIEPVAGECGHGDRVAVLAEEVAMRVGIDRPELAYQAGALHDVGKAALPFDPTVLPRELTPHERTQVETHPELGALIVAEAGYPDPVVEGVLLHHERLDGSGYPFGLSRAEVPLLAQVVAAVDVYDALSTARCYKEPWSRNAVLRFGEMQRGRWFLPEVWDALVAATA